MVTFSGCSAVVTFSGCSTVPWLPLPAAVQCSACLYRLQCSAVLTFTGCSAVLTFTGCSAVQCLPLPAAVQCLPLQAAVQCSTYLYRLQSLVIRNNPVLHTHRNIGKEKKMFTFNETCTFLGTPKSVFFRTLKWIITQNKLEQFLLRRMKTYPFFSISCGE